MRTISLWAGRNRQVTRLLIGLCMYFLVILAVWFLGEALASKGIYISATFYFILIIIILTLIFFYPFLNPKRNKYHYVFRKMLHVLMPVVTFGLVMIGGNNQQRNFAGQSIVLTTNAGFSALSTNEGKATPIYKVENPWKKLIKELRKKYKNATKDENSGKITLAIIVAILLILLLGILSFVIAYGGSGALAFILLFLGLGAIIYGLVRYIRKIKHGPPRKEGETSST